MLGAPTPVDLLTTNVDVSTIVAISLTMWRLPRQPGKPTKAHDSESSSTMASRLIATMAKCGARAHGRCVSKSSTFLHFAENLKC